MIPNLINKWSENSMKRNKIHLINYINISLLIIFLLLLYLFNFSKKIILLRRHWQNGKRSIILKFSIRSEENTDDLTFDNKSFLLSTFFNNTSAPVLCWRKFFQHRSYWKCATKYTTMFYVCKPNTYSNIDRTIYYLHRTVYKASHSTMLLSLKGNLLPWQEIFGVFFLNSVE